MKSENTAQTIARMSAMIANYQMAIAHLTALLNRGEVDRIEELPTYGVDNQQESEIEGLKDSILALQSNNSEGDRVEVLP